MIFNRIIIFACVIIITFTLSIRQYIQKKEYKINQSLKLKLEGGRTNIYVNNRLFRQCMYLLINIPVNKIRDYDEINSIDEVASKLDRTMERDHGKVPSETEFWGHCSNIQAWAENNYDTRILHRNLAFPLLKALSDAGDPVARQKFKEEIAIRYATGHPTVITYLTQNGYLSYLTEDEFESMLLNIDFPSIDEYARKIIYFLKNVEEPGSFKQIKQLTTIFVNRFRFKYKYLIILKVVEKIPKLLRQDFVELIFKKYKNHRSFPLLKFLNKAQINYDELDLKLISYDKKLVGIILNSQINLKNKMIEDIEQIEGLSDYRDEIGEIDLSNNRIIKIKGLEILKNLKKIYLKNNYIEKIEGLKGLNNLEFIDLSGNINITEIPKSLNKLPNLKKVKLTGCRIKRYSKSTSRFFWMGQNFRTYTNYSEKDVKFYENTHHSKAGINGRLYKNFVKWLLKIRNLKKEFHFKYEDIENFETKFNKNALWAGKPSKGFLKFLDDKKQLRITNFF